MRHRSISVMAAGILFLSACAQNASSQEEPKSSVPAEELAAAAESSYPVEIDAVITDAGQYIDKMIIDYGEYDISGLAEDTFEVYMTSTVDYGEEKGNPYAYYDASKPLEIVKTETDGPLAVLYFNQAQAPTLTWLGEGRNYPAVLGFTVEQKKELNLVMTDGTEVPFTAEYTAEVSSWRDLNDPEAAKFEDVQDEINYQFHQGTNDRLIVFFHGNGEGDFPVKETNNNVAQILANRGGAAWVSEAQDVFGDASVMCFQAPDMWYFALKDGLCETCYKEIMNVTETYGVDPEEIYLCGASAGGYMSVEMIMAYPDLFKSAMINCPALDAANERSGTDSAIPSDEDLAGLKDSETRIWLIQGETDSSVDPEECSKRIWNILT